MDINLALTTPFARKKWIIPNPTQNRPNNPNLEESKSSPRQGTEKEKEERKSADQEKSISTNNERKQQEESMEMERSGSSAPRKTGKECKGCCHPACPSLRRVCPREDPMDCPFHRDVVRSAIARIWSSSGYGNGMIDAVGICLEFELIGASSQKSDKIQNRLLLP